MKVILLQDVAKIGKRFSIVDLPNGYALNQLIPKKMAEPATPVNLKKIQQRHALTAASKEAGRSRFEAAKAQLLATPVTIQMDANEQGHLFKAVHEADIAEAAVANGIEVDKSMLKIAAPIKELGEHAVELLLDGDKAIIQIIVTKK